MSGGAVMPGVDTLAIVTKLGADAIINKAFRKAGIVEAIDRALSRTGAP
jgi:hypothetical protein